MTGLATAVLRVIGAGLPRGLVEARIGEAEGLAQASGRSVRSPLAWRVAAENVVLDQIDRVRPALRRSARG
jgi:hypothetical protein